MKKTFEDISQIIQDQKRSLKGKPLEYCIGIVGLGKVGREVYTQMLNTRRVNEIQLFTTKPDRTGQFLERQNIAHTHTSVIVNDFTELKHQHENLDIAILTVDQSNYLNRFPDISRDDVLESNVDLLVKTGNLLKDYKSSVIVVTNPVDLAAYIVCANAGIYPEQVTGLSHTDLARFRKNIRDVFIGNGLDPKFVNMIDVDVYGPHSTEATYVFQNFANLPRQVFTFLSNENIYSKLKEAAAQYANTQFELGSALKEGTERETAVSIREVVEAIIQEDKRVGASVYINPAEIGVKGIIPGLFMGYPTRFVSGVASPILGNFIDESDQARVIKGYHTLESKIIRLHESGIIPDYVERSFDVVDIYETKQTKVNLPKLNIQFQVIGACANQVIKWPDMDNPNLKEPIDLEQRVTAFSCADIDEELNFIVGHRRGITILSKSKKTDYKYESNHRVRKVGLIKTDRTYLVGANSSSVFVFDKDNPDSPVFDINGFNHKLESFELGYYKDRPYLWVVGDGVSEYSFLESEKLNFYEVGGVEKKIKALLKIRSKLYGANLNKVVRWNLNSPGLPRWESDELPSISVSCIEYAEINGCKSLFVGTGNPEVYRIDANSGELIKVYQKKQSNLNGTGQVKVLDNRYLLAADRNMTGHTYESAINIWDIHDKKPSIVLPTGFNSGIKGLKVLK